MSNLTTSIQITRQSRYRLNNGQQIPVTAFGCYDVPVEKTKELVYQALNAGYRHIDTAAGYGNEKEAAQAVAQFLKENPSIDRQDIWFTTKIANSDHGYEETKKAVQRASEKVKEYIEYVDLVLIHSPKSNKEKRLGTWKALQEFVTDATNPVLNIKSIGVSNFGISHLEELLNWDGLLVKPVVNQLELHPWLPHLKLRKYLVEHDILAEAYSPLTQGFKLNDKELLELEAKYKIPKTEILLKWSFLQGFIVLVKTEKVERIKQNLSVLPDVENDELDHSTKLGKIDLDIEILETLDKPDSHEVLTWGNVDPTGYVDPK